MKILFLHGWTSVPGGVKPTCLNDAGHEVLNPALPDDDFDESVRIAESEYNEHHPDVIVGSSRGGAVAVNMESGDTPLVLLCPAWKKWGTVTTIKPNSVILHSRQDDLIPFADSEELVANSGLPSEALVEVGSDHRLADPASLKAMSRWCERSVRSGVRKVFLVGESLPLIKSGEQKAATISGELQNHLVPLDPRHGVFPNLVMKPLFSAVYTAFKDKPSEALALLRECEFILCDQSGRRFNIFQPKVTDQENILSNQFTFDSSFERRIRRFNTTSELWFVFGHQTISGLLMWLLESQEETSRRQLKHFLKRFVDTAFSVTKNIPKLIVPSAPPTSASGRMGFVHRLCTECDTDESKITLLLAEVIQRMNTLQRFSNEEIAQRLRATIPLLHNEAYQDGPHPTGNAQNHFVRNASCGDSMLYWQLMGRASACRCFDRFVGEEGVEN